MHKILIALALITMGSTVQAQTNVGVSVSLGQPGFHGTIDLNNYPAPQVIYAQPRVIQASPVIVEPVYLRVPPGHRRHWDRYCGHYDACNRPVFLFQTIGITKSMSLNTAINATTTIVKTMAQETMAEAPAS